MTEHARDWIDVLQALLTPTIALIAVGIGYAQWWTARNKLKLDLFDRRWAVYVATRDMLSEMFTHGKTSAEAEQKFLQGIRGASWLLDARIDEYLRKEVWAKVALLNAANSMLEPTAPPQGRPDASKQKFEILKWVSEQDVAVDALFDKFLKMDEPLLGWVRERCRAGLSLLRTTQPL